MINKDNIKALAFDFGGTLDSPFLHWMDIYIKLYNDEFGLNLNHDNFRDIYITTERMLDNTRVIKSDFNLYNTQYCKASSHLDGFVNKGIIVEPKNEWVSRAAQLITDYCVTYINQAIPVLDYLSKRYTLLLVSNYYGNLEYLISDIGLRKYFFSLTDSTIENIRKPNSDIWRVAIQRANFNTNEVIIIGDSMKNDIIPGIEIGCQVIHGIPPKCRVNENITSITSITDLLHIL